MGYLSNIFVAIDQLGNALAKGNPDNTISSRVGHYTQEGAEGNTWYWNLFRSIIDNTFYPIDGDHHCHEAYYNDAGELFDNRTSNYGVAILAVIIIPSCFFIGFVLYILLLFRLVSPKKIDRDTNIKIRLKMARGKLNGVLHEIEEHDFEVSSVTAENFLRVKESLQDLETHLIKNSLV